MALTPRLEFVGIAPAGPRAIDEDHARLAERRMSEIVRVGHLVIDVEPVKSLAARLLRLHPLRAFDALQLAAALHWAEGHPQERALHTLDGRLALAAEREGFVVPP
jgi:predicted nucleic acid-binding protein